MAKYTPLSGFPGYVFSRSGTQGAVDASGAVQWFADNIPAINSAGYHAFGALTNIVTRSSEFDQWTKVAGVATVTTNTTAAPDGAMTADTLTEDLANTAKHVSSNTPAFTASAAHTFSIFAKAGTLGFVQLTTGEAFSDGTAPYANFNLTAGSVAAQANCTAYIVPLADGWYRCVMVATADAAPGGAFIAAMIGSGAQARLAAHAGSGRTLRLWGGQCLLGTFAEGGPLIATAGAASSIGASSLEVAATMPAGDFLAWSVINVPSLPSIMTVFSFSTAGAGTTNERLAPRLTGGSTLLELLPRAGGAAQPGPSNIASAIAAGRNVVLVGRRNGKYLMATRRSDGVVTIRDDASGTGLIPAITSVDVGCKASGDETISGRAEGLFQRNGTFSDAEITAILQAA